jgi:hypothetical protein
MLRRQLQTILVPAVLIGGYLFFASRDGFLADAWEDFAGPFLFTYWVGLGFVITWDVVRQSLHKDKASPRAMALWGIGLGLFMLMMLGGPAVLTEDPWLFGVVVAPGIELAMPWWRGRTSPPGPSPLRGEEEMHSDCV